LTFDKRLYIIVLVMKTNLVDINKLVSIINFGKQKGMSRQRIYQLMDIGKLDFVVIDGSKFIYLTEKSKNYKKQID
jgi:hypothetical protein